MFPPPLPRHHLPRAAHFLFNQTKLAGSYWVLPDRSHDYPHHPLTALNERSASAGGVMESLALINGPISRQLKPLTSVNKPKIRSRGLCVWLRPLLCWTTETVHFMFFVFVVFILTGENHDKGLNSSLFKRNIYTIGPITQFFFLFGFFYFFLSCPYEKKMASRKHQQ